MQLNLITMEMTIMSESKVFLKKSKQEMKEKIIMQP